MDNDVDAAPDWAEPYSMAKAYTLLYNTLAVRNSPYLPAQMDEAVWRLVYGVAAARPRHLCWAAARANNRESRAFAYAERRTTARRRAHEAELRTRIATLRDSADLGSAVRSRMVERARDELRRLEQPVGERFPRPPRTEHRELGGRSFEVQHHDAYLCGMHSLNNVANRVLLSPPDLLHAVELLRPLEPRFASYEELALAALREGIFLVPVKLTEPADLNPLDCAEPAPRTKFFLELLEEAGGMIVFQPSAPPALGHFVSLVHAPHAADINDEWAVYSTDAVVARGACAADALDRYIVDAMFGSRAARAARGANRESRRESAATAAGVGAPPELQFVGLLPLSLGALVDDATQVRPLAELDERARERVFVLRTLLRRSLSEMRLESAGDLTLPPPVAPGAFDTMCQFFAANRAHADDELHFDGLDVANVASFVTTRVTVDANINKAMNALAHRVLLELDSAAPWAAAEARADALATLVELRSYLRSLPALGLLFSMRESFGKFSRMLSNRRWFRYLVLQLALTAAIETLRVGRADVVPRRVFVLLCFVGFTNLQSAGVKLAAAPALVRLYARLGDGTDGAARAALLPLDDAPANIAELARSAPATQRGTLVSLLVNCSYDASLWLLRAIERARMPALPCNAGLAPLFALDDAAARRRVADQLPGGRPLAARDDSSIAYDQLSGFVTLLRMTLFAMPFECNDHALVERYAPPVRAARAVTPELGAHYHDAACRFVREATAAGHVDAERARRVVDALAFDARFADADWPETAGAAHSSARSLDDERRPRYAERLAQFGIDEAYRQTFGAFRLSADRRAPITDNAERVPLPRTAGSWIATRPRIQAGSLLATAPLSALPTLAQAERESTRFALDDEDPVAYHRTAARSKRAYEAPKLTPAVFGSSSESGDDSASGSFKRRATAEQLSTSMSRVSTDLGLDRLAIGAPAVK